MDSLREIFHVLRASQLDVSQTFAQGILSDTFSTCLYSKVSVPKIEIVAAGPSLRLTEGVHVFVSWSSKDAAYSRSEAKD